MGEHEQAQLRVISAPPGFGKTAALRGWAESAPHPDHLLIWITVDETLTTRAAFWTLVLYHLHSGGVALDDRLLHALDDPARAPFLPGLLASQFESARPLVLIIDTDAQRLDSTVVADVVRMTDLIAQFQAVVATREQPDGDTHRSWFRDGADVFPARRLLFSVEEIAEASDVLRVGLRPSTARRILDATAGWPAGVRAMLENLHDDASGSGDSFAQRLIAPFRDDPMFAALGTVALCDEVRQGDLPLLGLDEAVVPLLHRLARAGLGFWDGPGCDVLRLQPILRQTLRAEFAASDPEGKRHAHRVIARLHEGRAGEADIAFAHAVEAEDWEPAARTYRRCLLTMTERRAGSFVALHGLPAGAQQAHPILRFAAALEDFANGRRTRALQGLAKLLAVTEGRHLVRQATRLDDVWVQAIVMTSLRLLGRHELARSALHRLDRMIARVPDPDREIDEARSMLLTAGATTLLLAGHLREAAELLDDAGVEPLPDRPDVDRARVLGMRALIAALRGEVRHAQDAMSAYAALHLPLDFDSTYTALPAMVAAALIAMERGDVEAAERHLTRTDSHARTTELWSVLLRARVLISWQRDGAPTALATLEDIAGGRSRRSMHSPFSAHTIITLRVGLMLAMGRHRAARDLLAEAPQPRSRRWAPIRSRVEFVAGDSERAAALALDALSATTAPRERLTLLAIAAAAAARIGDSDDGHAYSAGAVALAHQHGLLLPFTAVPRTESMAVIASAPDLTEPISALRLFPADAAPRVALTSREEIVLRHLSADMTVDGIAEALSVSKNTVKTQLRSVYRKLGVDNRRDAVIEGRRRHLL